MKWLIVRINIALGTLLRLLESEIEETTSELSKQSEKESRAVQEDCWQNVISVESENGSHDNLIFKEFDVWRIFC